jgi:GLPGLI family protein
MKSYLVAMYFMVISISSFGQTISNEVYNKINISCVYRLTYRQDSLDTKTQTETMQLLIANDLSEFRSKNLFKRDSAQKEIARRDNAASMSNMEISASVNSMLQLPNAKFSYIIYKIPGKKQFLTYDNIMNVNYKYEEHYNAFKWIISQEKSNILGYTCQKATTSFAGRTYEAWFTKEIPVSDGPYKFSGLPGLIVKVYDIKKDYVFELTGLSQTQQNHTIRLPNNLVIPTTKSEFFSASRISQETAVDRAAQYGVSFTNPDQVRAKIRERLKRQNNPIELRY